MKVLINSLKRAHWFKASMALITCLSFLIFPSCQKDELNQENVISSSASSKSKKPKFKQEISDINGNVYNTVKIGKQVWMAENLKATKYNDGTDIPLVEDNEAWTVLTTPGYCWYENDELNYKNTYGPLYNWYAVNTGKLCPLGWHVPTNAEWHELILYLDLDAVEPEPGEMVVWESLIAGDNLKEAGTTHWNSPNTGTNSSGFTALPGGFRRYEGSFHSIGGYGDWWTTNEFDGENAWRRFLGNSSSYVWWDRLSKNYGFSIRCLKDN
jgi:uncharacterized protein (TIGR02145 family)